MATIASLAVQVSADARAFHTTMDRVAQKVAHVYGATKKYGATAFSSAGGVAGKLSGGNAAGALKSGVEGVQKTIGGILGSIPRIGPLLEAAFGTAAGAVTAYITVAERAIALFKEGAEPIKEMYASSRRLGVSMEEMATIQAAAGSSSEALEKGLFHLNRTLGDAVLGNEEAQRSFDRAGLSWKALAGMTKTQQLGAVFDALKKAGTGATGMKIRFDLLSKSAAGLGPVIDRGSAALQTGAAKAQRFAQSLSDVEAVQVLQADKALKQVAEAMKGIKMQAAVALAPVITGIADEFKNVGVDAATVRDVVVAGAKGMAYGGAAVVETWNGLVMVWDMLSVGFRALTATIADGVAEQLELAGKLPGIMGGDAFRGAAAKIRTASAKTWADIDADRKSFLERMAQPGPFQKMARFFEQMQARIDTAKKKGGKDALAEAEMERMQELARKAGDLQTKLDDQTAAYGRNAHIVEINKLARQGATEAMLAGVRASVAEIEALDRITGTATQTLNIFQDYAAKAGELRAALAAGTISAQGFAGGMAKIGDALQKSVESKAAEVFKSTRTPVETFMAKVEELNGLVDAGAISWDTYSRAVGTAAASIKGTEFKHSGAMEFGSQEAFKTIEVGTMADRGNDPMKRLEDAIKQERELMRRSAQANEELVRLARTGFVGRTSL